MTKIELLNNFWASKPEVNQIAKKVNLVMQEVEKVHKDGTNTFQRYKYVSEANVVAKLREAFVSHGLIAIPFMTLTEDIDAGATKQGTSQVRTNVEIVYQLMDIDSGQYLLTCVAGSGIDSGDKGIYKALTGANKYFLFKTFQIETSDDPEQPNQIDKEAPQATSNPIKDHIFRMKSKFPGTCKICGIAYVENEEIVKQLDGLVVHGKCFDANK